MEGKLGEITTEFNWLGKPTYFVCYEVGKHYSSSAIFKNFDLARIYSEIIKLKGGQNDRKND